MLVFFSCSNCRSFDSFETFPVHFCKAPHFFLFMCLSVAEKIQNHHTKVSAVSNQREYPRGRLGKVQLPEGVRVAVKHFVPEIIIRVDTTDGSILMVTGKIPKLADDCLPIVLPEQFILPVSKEEKAASCKAC